MSEGNNIRVVCRYRPQNKREIEEGGKYSTIVDEDGTTCRIDSKDYPGSFTFDKVFDWSASQSQLFDYTALATVQDVMRGYNGTIFAYGQTGSGKTHTMMGDMDNQDMRGLTPRLVECIFDTMLNAPDTIEFTVKVSFMEIYMERIKDLLNPINDNLPIHEDKVKGVYVKGLMEVFVGSTNEVFEAMVRGQSSRVVAFTNMNAESSRSHSIFVLHVSQKNLIDGSTRVGKLSLVDLAGSEKVGKTGASGQTLEEAKKINKSLSALGMVINSLTDGKSSHIPYRDSKLTRILQESLGGNSRTTLIINCSPSSFNEAETMSTLRFGMRAKTIENKAKVNAELSPTELKAILKKSRIEISYLTSYAASLESEIKQWRSGSSVPESTWVSLNSKSEKTTVAIDSTEDSILELTKPTIPDEKEDFLKRENELSDQIEEKEIELKKTLKLLDAIKSDYAMLQDRDALFAKENQSLSAEINHLKLQIEKTSLEIKENCILNDSLKQENEDINVKLDQLRIELANNANKSPSPPNTPERLAEPAIKDTRNTRMSQMMAEFDPSNGLTEKEREMRKTLSKLSTIGDTSIVPSNPDDILKQHIKFKEANAKLKLQDQLIQELSAKAKQLDLVSQQNITLSSKLDSLEVEYEQLLNDNIEEEVMHADNPVLAAIEDIKTKLEKHYSVKSDLNEKENVNLRLELEKKEIELDSIIKKLDQISIERLEMMDSIETSTESSSKIEIENMRKIMTQQLSDFDTTRKKLMRDFQERFERIVQLESSLEESREKYADLLSSVNDPNKLSNLESSLEETRNNYNNVLKNSNSKQHQGKLAFLERNLDHLASVQKQLVEKNSTLKKDLDVCERKLVARSDRISYLENQLQETQHAMEEQSTKFEAELGIIRSKLEEARTETAPASSWLYSSKIAKPLRGGVSTSRLANNEEDENDSVEAIKEGPKKQLKSKPSSWYMNLLNQ